MVQHGERIYSVIVEVSSPLRHYQLMRYQTTTFNCQIAGVYIDITTRDILAIIAKDTLSFFNTYCSYGLSNHASLISEAQSQNIVKLRVPHTINKQHNLIAQLRVLGEMIFTEAGAALPRPNTELAPMYEDRKYKTCCIATRSYSYL